MTSSHTPHLIIRSLTGSRGSMIYCATCYHMEMGFKDEPIRTTCAVVFGVPA